MSQSKSPPNERTDPPIGCTRRQFLASAGMATAGIVAVPAATGQQNTTNTTANGTNNTNTTSTNSNTSTPPSWTAPDVPQPASGRGELVDVVSRAEDIPGVTPSIGGDGAYTVLTLDAGTRAKLNIGDNETVSNVLVDVRAGDCTLQMNMIGSNPTVRNVGWLGENTISDDQFSYVHVTSSGGTALVENCWAGGGSVESDPNAYAGGKLVFVNRFAEERVVIRSCYIGPFPDNGIYASSVGRVDKESSKAPVYILGCYAINNNTANYRLGSDGSMIVGSVSVHNGPIPGKQQSYSGRGVWIREQGTIAIRNSQFYYTFSGQGATAAILAGSGSSPDGGHVVTQNVRVTDGTQKVEATGDSTVDESGVSDGAKNVIPPGVPTSARMAASGQGTAGFVGGPGGTATGGWFPFNSGAIQRAAASVAAGLFGVIFGFVPGLFALGLFVIIACVVTVWLGGFIRRLLPF